MNIRKFTENFGEKYPISVAQIKLYDPSFALQHLHIWEKKWWIIHIMRGWRLLPETQQKQGITLVIANALYEPSYLSLQRALRYYNLIPEWVHQYISCTTKRTTTYQTPLGDFIYRSLHPRYYRWYTLIPIGDYNHIRIATPEKVICDYIYLHPAVKNKEDFEEQRINKLVRKDIASDKKLIEYAKNFPVRVQKIIQTFLDYIHWAHV